VQVEVGQIGYPHRGKLETRTPTRLGRIEDFSIRICQNMQKPVRIGVVLGERIGLDGSGGFCPPLSI
jgi:hypothetical protein